MKRILFICSGNMYRSAGAEFILRKKLTEAGIEGWTVDSAGTLQLGHASLVLSQQVTATPCSYKYSGAISILPFSHSSVSERT